MPSGWSSCRAPASSSGNNNTLQAQPLAAAMQEFQPIPGLAGRLFGGAADIRRAQQAHHHQGPAGARCDGVSPEAVKCPRCDSTNTKFCYYNNYNLSQPRHFCKSCRRYWTKGGVLRNVPVGGGCRKAKRSSSSSTSSSSAPSTPTSADAANAKHPRRASASSPRSNSGGSASSPSAAATTPTPTTPATPSSNPAASHHHHHASSPFSTVDVAPPAPIFADQAAALASLFAPPPPPPLPVFGFAAQPPKEESELQQQQLAGHAAPPPPEPADMTPFAPLDAAGMFELGDAPAAAYWHAGSCWADVQDPSLYLP